MLGVELRQPGDAGAARHFIQRSISLAQRDDLLPVIETGQQLTETPNPAIVGGKSRSAALLPESLERGSVWQIFVPAEVDDLQQISATGAAEILCCLLIR